MAISGRVIFVMALILLVVWVFAGVLPMVYFDSWSIRGQFGDMFGAVNALFSGLAFGGVIVAILLQRRELELQREELSLTRKELAISAAAQRESAVALTKQVEIQAITAELNALVAISEPGLWRGVSGGPQNLSQLKLQIPVLLETIQSRRRETSAHPE